MQQGCENNVLHFISNSLYQQIIAIISMKATKLASSFMRPPSEARIDIDLQLNLFNAWAKYYVADYYQQIFLAYLDEQKAETIEKEIKREIKQTIEKSTYFFKVQGLQLERQKQLASLQETLKNKGEGTAPEQIQEICEEVSKLRNLNLQIAQSLIKMHEKFKCYNHSSLQKQTPYYDTLFEDLDQQNAFIKDSILSQYMKFDDGYDPFLMDPYEQFHRRQESEQETIKSLFNLNISYVYRLIRAKNSIIEIRSKFKDTQPTNERTINKKLNEYATKQGSQNQFSRLAPETFSKQSYEPKTVETASKKHSLSQFTNPIKIAPIKVYPSPIPEKSRTTLDPIHAARKGSPSLTDKNYELVFSRVSKTDSLQDYEHFHRNQKKQKRYHKYCIPTEPNQYQRESKASRLSRMSSHKVKPSAQSKQSKNNLVKLRPQKLEPIKIEKMVESNGRDSSLSKGNTKSIHNLQLTQKKSQPRLEIVKEYQIKEQVVIASSPKPDPSERTQRVEVPEKAEKAPLPVKQRAAKQRTRTVTEPDGEGYEIKNYNPIKKNQFQLIRREKPTPKYDFVQGGSIKYTFIDEEQDDSGLSNQRPIFKYNKKSQYPKKYNAPQSNLAQYFRPTKAETRNQAYVPRKSETPTVMRVEQESQTMQEPNRYPYENPQNSLDQPNRKASQGNPQATSQLNSSNKGENQVTQSQNTNNGQQDPQNANNYNQNQYQPSNNNENLSASYKPKESIGNTNNQQSNFQPNSNPQPQPRTQLQAQSNNMPNQGGSSQQSAAMMEPSYQNGSPNTASFNSPTYKNANQSSTNPNSNPSEQISTRQPQQQQQQSTKPNQDPVLNKQNSTQANQPLAGSPEKQQSLQFSPRVAPSQDQIVMSTTAFNQKEERREIKMKVGKATVTEMVSLLQTSSIKPEHKTLFGIERLIELVKVSQTYLTEFHINNSCAIIALCSPIPGIGMAIKLWAPIHPSIDSTISNNLFLKYVEYIQKSTSVEKIMFSGNGDGFVELKFAEFTKKKQNLFERLRKIPPKQNALEFKPFLYVECSTVNFSQTGSDTVLFSEQIEQFSPTNCYISSFMAEIDKKAVPASLQPLVKIDQNVKNFEEANKILTAESFDNYEAGDMKISSINILRFYLNTHFKASFIACDGHFQFVGNLLYEKDEQRLVSLQTSKSNGVVYFAKNMGIKSLIQKRSIVSNNKVKICIKMFHKALYGKLPNKQKGLYGNWEINLTWEDEMQGRVKHNLPQGLTFGSEGFCIGIEVEKELVYCAEIKKEDFIY